MRIRVFDTPKDAGIYAAALVEQIILQTDHAVLGLATGSTVIPLYEQLVRLHRNGLDMSHVRTINLDEYVGLPADHPQSYHNFMRTHLFQHVNIPAFHSYIPDGNAADLEQECARYDEVVRKHPLDMQILGIGVNGHIGFNEPDDLLLSKTHVVTLSEETIRSNARFFECADDVPRQAITLGVQAILQAKRIVLMAFGKEKADAVAKSIQGQVRTDVPASILQLHRDVTFVLDMDSASKLAGYGG
ncbi:glucosamine-6-phosphate deaminase [Alicyclobacillus acidiphilus]|uniref:glucosamine-6-phosphate deaminase n=1 Tax=Alicyclobacillus acidiphilus TaxID=182455 RepID=UPI00082CB291|nr:glucosamine-6-phosphate deaminase [Alicyclobacillus acidiphilus]